MPESTKTKSISHGMADELTEIMKSLASLIEASLAQGTIKNVQITESKPQYDMLDERSIPMIAVYDNDFQIEDMGLGTRYTISQSEDSNIRFSGDGSKMDYVLPNEATNKAVSVKISGIEREYVESKDYDVKTLSSLKRDNKPSAGIPNLSSTEIGQQQVVISFHVPPPKGVGNIIVQYLSEETGNVVKLKVACSVDILARTSEECNSTTISTLKSLLARRSVEELGRFGTRLLPPIKGETINISRPGSKIPISAKRILFTCERELRIIERKELGRMIRIPLKETVLAETGSPTHNKQ